MCAINIWKSQATTRRHRAKECVKLMSALLLERLEGCLVRCDRSFIAISLDNKQILAGLCVCDVFYVHTRKTCSLKLTVSHLA